MWHASCGDHFSVLMTLDGQVLACGSNSNGAIGQPIHLYAVSKIPIPVMGQNVIKKNQHVASTVFDLHHHDPQHQQQPNSVVCGNRFTFVFHSSECVMDILLKAKHQMHQRLLEQLQRCSNEESIPIITFQFCTQ